MDKASTADQIFHYMEFVTTALQKFPVFFELGFTQNFLLPIVNSFIDLTDKFANYFIDIRLILTKTILQSLLHEDLVNF